MLTKSDFLIYLDSPLHLWAHTHGMEGTKVVSVYDEHLSKQGYAVEKLAKQFLENKLLLDYSVGSTITFQQVLVDGDYEARLDALVHDVVNDSYDIYEIKSTTKVEQFHKYDATFQYLIGKTSLPIRKVFLVRVNGDYIKDGELSVNSLFVVEDLSDVVLELEDDVYQKRVEARGIVRLDTPPVDEHCYSPKTCPCKDLCHKDLPEYSIYDLPYGNAKKYQSLLDMGINSLSDIKSDFKLSERQKWLVQSIYLQKPIIQHKKIKEELGKLEYPLYFLDYETFGTALPIHDHYKPYQNITFQYSLHVVENPDDEGQHYEFLAADEGEPSKGLCDSLLSHIGSEGTIIVWHKSFECGRNSELAELQIPCAEQLWSINKRTFDLKEIFSKSLYVDFRFHGSASIKDVLPVLIPKLSYKELDIAKGDVAMTKWYEMVYGQLSESEKEKIKFDLLTYCKLDTLAMVEIWRYLINLEKHQEAI